MRTPQLNVAEIIVMVRERETGMLSAEMSRKHGLSYPLPLWRHMRVTLPGVFRPEHWLLLGIWRAARADVFRSEHWLSSSP